jgi:hypothetical protein
MTQQNCHPDRSRRNFVHIAKAVVGHPSYSYHPSRSDVVLLRSGGYGDPPRLR